MEVKINREIRNYTESIFFGLSLRQFICSVIACAVAVLIYFIGKKYLSTEVISWLCILGASPFAAMGFIKYNGMNMEELAIAFIKSEILIPKELKFESTNLYYDLMDNYFDKKIKEDLKK